MARGQRDGFAVGAGIAVVVLVAVMAVVAFLLGGPGGGGSVTERSGELTAAMRSFVTVVFWIGVLVAVAWCFVRGVPVGVLVPGCAAAAWSVGSWVDRSTGMGLAGLAYPVLFSLGGVVIGVLLLLLVNPDDGSGGSEPIDDSDL